MVASPNTLLFASTVGAAALALWVVARWPHLGPRTLLGAVLHVAAAFACGQLVGPALRFVVTLPIPDADVVAVLVAGVPPLVYLFLAFAWLFRAIQRLVTAYP